MLSNIVVRCTVPLADALKEGRIHAGDIDVPLTHSLLLDLRAARVMDLVELHFALAGVAAPDLPRLAIHPPTDALAVTPVQADMEKRVIRALTAIRDDRDKTLELHGKLVDYAGDHGQRVRFAAGVLPYAELEDMLRSAVLAEVTAPRYTKMGGRDLCEHGESLIFLTSPCNELTAAEHDALSMLAAQLAAARNAASAFIEEIDLEVGKLEHHATCTRCQRRFARRSAQVRFCWAGLAVGREYQLTIGPPRVTSDK